MASVILMNCEKCAHENVCRYSAGVPAVKQSLSYTTALMEAKPFNFHVCCRDYLPKKEGVKDAVY